MFGGRSIAAAVLALAACCAAPPASAGTYEIDQCRTPSGEPVPLAPEFLTWTHAPIDRCGDASDPGVGITLPGSVLPAVTHAGWRLSAPEGLSLMAIDGVISTGEHLAGEPVNLSIVTPAPGWTGTAGLALGGALWPSAYRNLALTNAGTIGAKWFSLYLEAEGESQFGPGPIITLHRVRVTLADDVPPAPASFVRLGLLDGDPQVGTRTLTYSAADAESGIANVNLRSKDGTVVAIAPDPAAGCSFTRPAPCPQLHSDRTIAVDTTRLANGTHELELWTQDVGGNLHRTPLPSFVVDNPPVLPAPTPGPPPANGKAGDAATGRIALTRAKRTLRVDYGERLEITGRVTDAAGLPLAGASIDVYDRLLLSGAQRRLAGSVTTDGLGAFSVRAKTTASRVIEVAFASQQGSSSYRSTQQFTVEVRPKVTLRLARSQIAAAGIGRASGKVTVEGLRGRVLVELQARERGRWEPAGVVRTDRRGNFTWRHRFKTRKAVFPLRAVVRRSGDMPGVSSASRTVRLRVG